MTCFEARAVCVCVCVCGSESSADFFSEPSLHRFSVRPHFAVLRLVVAAAMSLNSAVAAAAAAAVGAVAVVDVRAVCVVRAVFFVQYFPCFRSPPPVSWPNSRAAFVLVASTVSLHCFPPYGTRQCGRGCWFRLCHPQRTNAL
jgi:hypothetical protein